MSENRDVFLRISVDSEAETADVARALSARLAVGDVVLLNGTLGAGKTAFSRALIRAVMDDPALIVASPTFTFSQIYEGAGMLVTHFDLYRMGEPEEVFDLGWDDALTDGVTLVEWPDKLGALAPDGALSITIDLVEHSPNARTLSISGDAEWQARLAGVSL